MKITRHAPFSASINLGRKIGFDGRLLSEEEVKEFISAYQDQLISSKKVYLSVCISDCRILLGGLDEPHFRLGFINYPKFSLPLPDLKYEIEELARSLLTRFSQNRMVIEYMNETVMLEVTDEIDPAVKE